MMRRPTHYQQGVLNDDYPGSQGPLSYGGYLTPQSTFEGRRDSIASSQSSYTQGFGSSDCSMPATPTCVRSPLVETSYVDTNSFDLLHEFQGQQMHGLPLSSQPKAPLLEDDSYEPWMMVHPPVATPIHSMTFNTQHTFPDSTDLALPLHGPANDHYVDGVVSSPENGWDVPSTTLWPETNRYRQHQVDGHGHRHVRSDNATLGGLRDSWSTVTNDPIAISSLLPSETMLPSDVVMVDYNVDGSEDLDEDAPHTPTRFLPLSPQEVFFKRENSEQAEENAACDNGAGRLRERMQVSSTGAKTVKKEGRRGGSARKKNKSKDLPPSTRQFKDDKLWLVIGDGVERDEVTGELRRSGGTRTQLLKCRHFSANGRACTSRFKRREHLHRHERTCHNGEALFSCLICDKRFGRNDNCVAHYDTHIRKPGKKDGRNRKMPLEEVLEAILVDADPEKTKLAEKLMSKNMRWELEQDES